MGSVPIYIVDSIQSRKYGELLLTGFASFSTPSNAEPVGVATKSGIQWLESKLFAFLRKNLNILALIESIV